jgi:hypothetical protein
MESRWLAPAGWMLGLVRESIQSLIFGPDGPHRSSVVPDPELAAAATLVLLGLVAYLLGKLTPRFAWVDRVALPVIDGPTGAASRTLVSPPGPKVERQDLAHPVAKAPCPVARLVRVHASLAISHPIAGSGPAWRGRRPGPSPSGGG